MSSSSFQKTMTTVPKQSYAVLHRYLPPEVLGRAGLFLTGRDISVWSLAVVGHDNNANDDATSVSRARDILQSMLQHAHNACETYLSHDAPLSLLQTWRLFSASHWAKLFDKNDAKGTATLRSRFHVACRQMRLLSEWCAVLDYCHGYHVHQLLQEDYNDYTVPSHKTWCLGGGTIATSVVSSAVVLTSHMWSPTLFIIAERWFTPAENQFAIFFDSHRLSCFEPQRAVGVLSWASSQVLRTMHWFHDIDGGLIVSQEENQQGSALIWLPKATKDIYGTANPKLEQAHLPCIRKITSDLFDNHMLCTWDVGRADNNNDAIFTPEYLVQNGFAEKVLRLLHLIKMVDGQQR